MNWCLAMAWLLLASGPGQASAHEQAIEQLRVELAAQPNRLDLWLAISWRQEMAGHPDAALLSAEKALALADVYDTRLRLGWLLLQAERCPEALVHYRAASSHAPASEDPLLGQQACLLKAENFPEAWKVGDQLLKLNPDNLWALRRQAYTLSMLERFEEAEPMYRRVLRESPNDPEMRLGLGWCRLRAGDLDDGHRQCALAAETLKNDPRVEACLESGDSKGVIFSGSLYSGLLSYSGQTDQLSLATLSLAAALTFENGVELVAGLTLIKASAKFSDGDYGQSNPVLSFGYAEGAWRWRGVFTYLVADNEFIHSTPVISAKMQRLGEVVDFDLELSGTWYGALMALQVSPGLRWHLPGDVDLFVGGEAIGLWKRSVLRVPGAWGSVETGWTWYGSGKFCLSWQALENWSLHAGGFYGLRRFAVDDGGWSIWNNDDRFLAGYQVGTHVNISRHWSLFAEFRHLFGDQQDGADADFMLVGGVAGLRAWY
ncbi:MAG: tetratricopeptide repeat protein [Deltaproteobacteria bacterium]|nr:tetratricopeptide repeat protein [Deltaproteobacteria bacterium]